jgi:hypothetical protein
LDIQAILAQKATEAKAFPNTTFSDLPGIYFFYYSGAQTVLAEEIVLATDTLLYIGKTETSQKSRNQKTHFSSGRTGGSVIRRTLATILAKPLSLQAIPRGKAAHISDGKFQLTPDGEQRLTAWMQQHITIAFLPVTSGTTDIKQLEHQFIVASAPLMNKNHNPGNPHLTTLHRLREQFLG